MHELGAVRGHQLGPALAEVPGRDDEVPLTGIDEVRHRRLERAGPRRGEEEHVVVRPEDLLQAPEHAVVRPREVRAPVVHDRLGHDRQHLRRDGRRARGEEVALLRHGPRSVAEPAAVAQPPGRCPENDMTCWNVGRFVNRAVSGRNPNAMRSRVASDRHAATSGPCDGGELGGGRVDRGPERGAARASRRRRSSARENRAAPADRAARGGPARRSRTTRSRTSCRRARAGRRASRAARAARSAVPSTGASTASASRGQAASRTAAPGLSIFPSSSRSRRLDARGVPGGHGRGGLRRPRATAPARSRARPRSSGQTTTARRSWVAAAFIAPTTVASVCRRRAAIPRSRSCTRCTEPHEN